MKRSHRFMRVFVVCVLGLGFAGPAAAEPYRPADDSEILERLPAGPADTESVRKPALAPELAARLARTYIERGRQSGDPRELGYAQGVLQPWWNATDAPDPILLLRATLRQARHDFEGSLNDLDRLLARRPDDAQAWLTRATVLRVQGRYPEALESCARLKPLVDRFVDALCRESIRGLHGELPAAIAALDELQPALNTQPASIAAWFYAERADMAVRAGNAQAAETMYREALARHADDIDLLASLADLMLDRGAPDEVLGLIPADTAVDALRLRLALALHQIGDLRFGAMDEAMRDGFDAARRRGEALHLREEARYRLAVGADPERTLEIALENWAIQHEPWDARVLLEAAKAAGRPAAATTFKHWRASSRLEDARLDR
ncbi:MAG: tetratricopeptide repeat protein [Panacagrimonas sp.]